MPVARLQNERVFMTGLQIADGEAVPARHNAFSGVSLSRRIDNVRIQSYVQPILRGMKGRMPH